MPSPLKSPTTTEEGLTPTANGLPGASRETARAIPQQHRQGVVNAKLAVARS